jgi:hypothetical protein
LRSAASSPDGGFFTPFYPEPFAERVIVTTGAGSGIAL